MEPLFEYQSALLDQVDDRFFRAHLETIDWEERMFGIIGLRGVGKTTLLLQYLKYRVEDRSQALYVTAEHPWFFDHTLFDLAGQFVKYGGWLLVIDEIHKYEAWSRELKLIYDAHPGLQVIFSASSALDILKGEADLSRRAVTHELPGLSFREYLALYHRVLVPRLSLEQLLADPADATSLLVPKYKPLPLFRSYLKMGYFPFGEPERTAAFQRKLNQVIATVLETDLQLVEDYSASNTFKLKRLLGVLAESAPFEPNISKLASKLEIGRDTVKIYLQNLEQARMLNLLQRSSKGSAALQKPDKIYLENSNLSYALKTAPEIGTIRETFFLNQLRHAGHQVSLPKQGDFLVDGSMLFEVGGPSKDERQIAAHDQAWLALDDIEHPFLNRIPLWLFGMLY